MPLSENSYQDALAFAAKKHQGQIRIGGEPYISHPIAVADMVREWGFGLSFRITALFHDLLEDTDATEEDIFRIGGAEVLDAVRRLTKRKGYVMADYVQHIRENEIARVVKAADRLHNLRCAVVADDAFKRKYILESLEWYLDFSPQILPAVRALALSMQTPVADHPLLS